MQTHTVRRLTMHDAIAGPGLRFHHVGVACVDLDIESRRLALLGYVAEGADFEDSTQGVRGRFLGGQVPRLELLVQTGTSGVLDPWLANGTKLYHLAYESDDLDAAVTALCAAGARVVVPAVPAVAFGDRQITFLLLRTMLLVELISAR